MMFEKFESDEQNHLIECVAAVIDGPFINNDLEFEILFGLPRSNARTMLNVWRRRHEENDEFVRLVGNSLCNATGYPIDCPDQWENWFSVIPDALRHLREKWFLNLPRLTYDWVRASEPRVIDGSIYRFVTYQITGGGQGISCEIWRANRWKYSETRGYSEIRDAPIATPIDFQNEGLDSEQLVISADYDPCYVDEE